MTKNVFTYWQGPKPDLITELESRLAYICKKNGYTLYNLNNKCIRDYIDIPESFSQPNTIMNITSFIRIELLIKYGGIWIDKDVLAINEFDYLFDTIEKHDGFVVGFPISNDTAFNNAIIGSIPNSEFYIKWSEHNHKILTQPKQTWGKVPFGVSYLKKCYKESLFDKIAIINGFKNRMEYFSDFRVNKLLSDIDTSVILDHDPSLVHFFNRNCKAYYQMNQERRKKTLLYKLIEETRPPN